MRVKDRTGQAGLVLAAIDRRETRLRAERVAIPVPTWGGDLVARHRRPTPDDWAEVHARESEEDQDLALIAVTCEALSVRDRTGRLVELEYRGEPVTVRHGLEALLVEEEPADDGERLRWLVHGMGGALASWGRHLGAWLTGEEVR